MRFDATVIQEEDGTFVATCAEAGASGHGLSPLAAIEALRAEIRYRVELCPCSSVDDDWVQIDAHGQAAGR